MSITYMDKGERKSGNTKKPAISTKLPAGIEIPGNKKKSVPREKDEVREKPRAVEVREQPRTEERKERISQEGKQTIVLKDSYLSAKLRKQEAEKQQNRPRKSPGTFGGINELMMENMWKDMEQQISYDVPQGKEIPRDFLDSIGISGEHVMISPRAIAALREILGGKKNV